MSKVTSEQIKNFKEVFSLSLVEASLYLKWCKGDVGKALELAHYVDWNAEYRKRFEKIEKRLDVLELFNSINF